MLAVVASWWPDNFAPGEAMISPGAKDIAVSREDTTYPTSDALRFDERPEVVYVYVRVEDLAKGDLGATVGRTARDSVVGWLIGGDTLRVVDRSKEPLSVSGSGVSGVLKFAVRSGSGGRLPAGDYTVEVYNEAHGSEGRATLARKYFVVGH